MKRTAILLATTTLGIAGAASTASAQISPAPVEADQTAADAAPADPTDSGQDIVVTGSRVSRPGYTAPTPVTSLSNSELTKSSPSTIADALRTLPALTNTSGTQRNSGSAGGGQSFLNLRGLGATRTLTLVDGRRFVSTNITGSVDANLIPSALVERVDIVTGGASAAYGSDAVAGVVNFVIDTRFKGLKGSAQYGISSEGDNREFVATLTGGTRFADDRGRIVVSGEYFRNDGIDGDARRWARSGYQVITRPGAAGTAADPTQILAANVRLVSSYGGLILNGNGGTAAANASFRGITFNPDGSPRAFDFGTLTSTGTQVGGDGIDNGIIQQINRPLERKAVFGHATFDVTPEWNVFVQASYGDVRSDYINGPNVHNSSAAQTAFITIQRDNAFLPQAVRDQMLARGVTSLTMTRWDLEDGKTHTDNRNRTTRVVGGFAGKVGSWSLDGYYQWGQNLNTNIVKTTNRIGNFTRAVDAVRTASGAVVCRSTLSDPTNGCVPFNPFGVGAPSQAALAYVNGDSPAYIRTTQQAAALNLSGEPFATWAGPVSLAVGAEYRRETARVRSDALSVQNGYKIGNQQPWSGDYDIREFYAETVVPLARDMTLLNLLEVNGAVRRTDYSTSGAVTTWKGGVTYKPVDDLRLRLTRSRDIRAPNLNELFSRGRQNVSSVRDPFRGNILVSNVSSLTTGNAALQPEIAETLTYGGVFSPSFVPGLQLSVDYYKLRIDGAIATVTDQIALDQCFAGAADFCALSTRDASGNLTAFRSSPINYSRLETSGIDIEASYRVPMADWIDWWRGQLTLRAVANRVNHFTTSAPGLVTRDVAGSIVDSQPKWRGQAQIGYTQDTFDLTLIGRYIGGGTYDVSRTPAQLGFRDVAPQAFLDGQLAVNIPAMGKGGQLYFNVRNILNTEPRIAPLAGNLAIVTNPFLYDTVGRMFRIGIRAEY
ncbi:TonB-dependent receptor domain-containing protein [Sphingomonas hankookensis]|uniref:TonB-dependent receptor domain-containing protein n=1 Tax=Sphingomonas hankookensis TaxID=563996 RepID=UPI001F5AB0FF|nr:TonB-dependent receptor [Sphingomonas hankookensis]